MTRWVEGGRSAVALAAILLVTAAWSSVARAGPAFPWTSFRAIAQEEPTANVAHCVPGDDGTRVTAFLIGRAPEFYQVWATVSGPDWVAVHYNGEGRPDWVWHGVWSGDRLSVAAVSAYDPVAHATACDMLFNGRR
jgi:hypothetical protein